MVHHGHASRTTVGLWASADAGALNRSNARAGELGHARRFFSLPLKVSEAVPGSSRNLIREKRCTTFPLLGPCTCVCLLVAHIRLLFPARSSEVVSYNTFLCVCFSR